MVVLADEILESFFETDLSASFKLEDGLVELPAVPASNSSFLGGLISSIVTDDNKKLFNRFTDEIGKSIGKHQVWLPYNHLDIHAHSLQRLFISQLSAGP